MSIIRKPPPKTAVVMVGLPARGKSYMSRKLARFLSWIGLNARVFNVGAHRRARIAPYLPASFYDPNNQDSRELRRTIADETLSEMLAWLAAGGDVGLYDATNTTRSRRAWVAAQCRQAGLQVMFVESICQDPDVIEANIRETKLLAPDYAHMTAEDALADFQLRLAYYEAAYEPLDERESGWIKLIDVGRQVVTHEIRGWLPARVVYFLMNLHIQPRTIWLTRHGQSAYNLTGRLGGDAPLSSLGRQYAQSLAAFVNARVPAEKTLEVWTSNLLRTTETGEPLDRPLNPWRELDEIDAGICEGMTYKEIAATYPEEYAARKKDKLRYRYPRGESYQDVMKRIEPVIIELERQREPVLIISHQAVQRAVYGYFKGIRPEQCPHLEIPLHTVIELRPNARGCDEERFKLEPDVPQSSSSS